MVTLSGHSRWLRIAIVLIVLGAGLAVGWLAGGGQEATLAEAKTVPFVPASSVQSAAFTPPADVQGLVTVKGAPEFGGTGSSYVCDRERLIGFLVTKPDHLRAWARVQGKPATADAVANYIRSLDPVTLVEPTRVTDHTFVDGHAVAAQALLAQGSAVLVDDQNVIRVRCRSGSPLRKPVMAAKEECEGCPKGYRPPPPLLTSPSYVVHPSPPPVKGEKPARVITRPVTVEVVKKVAPQYVQRETTPDDTGKPVVKTVTVFEKNGDPAPPRIKIKTVPGPTRTVTVKGPTRTVTVNGPTRTVAVPSTSVTRTVTVQVPVVEYRTRTVYEGSG